MKKIVLLLVASVLVFSIVNFAFSQESETKYCCEKTDYGAWCQNAPEDQCDSEYRKTPTSCDSTSYCELGCCYDSTEGTCMQKTSQKVCDDAGGTWSDDPDCDISQCQLGCCLLGDEASFVTLTRCKKMSSEYGLETDFNRDVDSEEECIALANEQDEGACVYEVDHSKTCEYTTRKECNEMDPEENENGTVTSETEFHEGYLCSADELETDCGPTEQTTCHDGKVYWVDSCGNKANIYDSSKVDDKSYWRKKVDIEDTCGSGGSKNSKSCGNCEYFEGSTCKDYEDVDAPRPNYGTKICASLDCPASAVSGDEPRQHGESWCSTDEPENSVGSRYFKHICMNGEEIIEPCADYRQEVCREEVSEEDFSQAGCVVNRWEDCYSQTDKQDCENGDKRDCQWIYEEDSVDYESGEEGEEGQRKPEELACVPEDSPGLEFWDEESSGQCSTANNQCVVKFVDDSMLSGEEECEDNCECLDDSWRDKQLETCELVGDCGGKSNWVGQSGNKKGYEIEQESADSESKD